MRPEIRLSRLEAVVDVKGADLSRLTDDELKMEILDCSRSIAANPSAPAEVREQAAQHVAESEDGIRRQALARREPSYSEHLAKVAGSRFPDYVPCVCGDLTANPGSLEYQDLNKPQIMERRAAILARPDVQALLAEVDGVVGYA